MKGEKNITINVNLKDTDKFKEVLNIIKEFLADERVPREVKQEFKEKILSITESKS